MNNDYIESKLNADEKGFYIGNRLILPFRCNLIKLIADNHIYTEFVGNEDVKVSQDTHNTSIYFRESGRLKRFDDDSYELVKLVVADLDVNLCDRSNHIKLICELGENHTVTVRKATREDLFIE